MKMIGHLVTKYPKSIIVVWVALLVFMTLFAAQLPGKLKGDGFTIKGDHSAVLAQLTTTFDLPKESIFIVFYEKSEQEIAAIIEKVGHYSSLHSIQSPLEDPSLFKENIAYAIVHFNNQVEDMSPIVQDMRNLIGSNDNVTITGSPVIANDISLASQKDLISAEAIGLPIALIVLLLAFGSVVAALIPIIVGVISVVSALGLLNLVGDRVDLSIFVLNIVPMLGLALSIDFALLFINRYREERNNKSITEAIQITIETAGRSIIFSAVCVMIGLGAMLVIRVDIFTNIALGGTIVVALAALSGLTLLPALICVLKDRLNKWTLIRVKSNHTRWERMAQFVIKRPIIIACAAFIILFIGVIPVKDIKLTIPQLDALPSSYESRIAFERLQNEFDLGKQTVVYLLAEREQGWTDGDGLAQILAIQQQLEADSLVGKVSTLFTESNINSVEAWQQSTADAQTASMLEPLMNTFIQDKQLFIPINLVTDSSSDAAKDWVADWMNKDLGIPFQLGGEAKFKQEIFDETSNKIGLAIAIIMVSTFFILMIAFRSLLIPLKAILMNVLGLGSTFGILVYIFQYGHFGLEAGSLSLIIPVIVFCLVFGLSMDYEVFLISRIQEEYEKSGDNTAATINGLVSTSKIITSAALIMIVLTGAFAFTDIMPVKQIGVGIAIAIAIDATIIRLLLVPSLMKLLGDWNWWLPFRKNRLKNRSRSL